MERTRACGPLSGDALSLLAALEHGPLDHRQLAVDLQRAPFTVRRLIEELRASGHVAPAHDDSESPRELWALTTLGNTWLNT